MVIIAQRNEHAERSLAIQEKKNQADNFSHISTSSVFYFVCTEKTKHEGTDGISHEDFTSPYLCVCVRARVFVRVCVLFDGYLLLAQIKLCG